jgi:hypothetical protein
VQNRRLDKALNLDPGACLKAVEGLLRDLEQSGYQNQLLQRNAGRPRRPPLDDFRQNINGVLNSTLQFAFSGPPHFAESGYNYTPILAFLHMCAPSLTIFLHQATKEQASIDGITPSSPIESQALRLVAAQMIASTMGLVSHVDVASPAKIATGLLRHFPLRHFLPLRHFPCREPILN